MWEDKGTLNLPGSVRSGVGFRGHNTASVSNVTLAFDARISV